MSESIETSKLFISGLLAIVLAIVVNLIIYFIGGALDVWTGVINPATGGEIQLIEVIFATIMQMGVGLLFLFALTLVNERPLYWFRIIGTVVLVMSFAMPLALGNNPGAIAFLETMHIFSGFSMLVFLPKKLQ